jgi:acetyl-CoA carboxylase biotin carboxyl carrier protein
MAKRSLPAEPLSRKDVRELIELIRANQIEEFELEQGDLKLRIVSTRSSRENAAEGGLRMAPPMYPPPAYYYGPGMPMMPPSRVGVEAESHAVAPAAAANPALAPAPAVAAPKAPALEDDPNLIKITSPMVGSFYRAPAPDAKPYVDRGSRVEENTVLCIVEAMKLMNEIKAETRGTVRAILVENGQPVEYGQTLFLIDPN